MHDPYAIRRTGIRPGSVPGVDTRSTRDRRATDELVPISVASAPAHLPRSDRRGAPPAAHRLLDATADAIHRSGPALLRLGDNLVNSARRGWSAFIKRVKR